MTAQHERYEQQLKESAEKAFAELPPEHEEEAKAAHNRLLNWLVSMDHQTKDPTELVSDDLSDTACNAFEDSIGEMQKVAKEQGEEGENRSKKLASVLKAFNKLPDEDQLTLMKLVLGQTFAGHVRNCALVARANDLFLWENVGFHIDGELKCAFAKVGRQSFQAIGFDDGERYIGTEGSKTLWVREFGMALILPYAPPFHVEQHEIHQDPANPLALSDKEREKIWEVIGMFEEDLAAYSKLKAEDKEQKAECEDKIREGIKLARIRLPRLDQKLDEFLEEHPDVGQDFENVALDQLLLSMQEFLRMKLDDDQVRREVEASSLSTNPLHEEQRQLLSTLMTGISRLIPEEGKEPEADSLLYRINEAATAIPAIRELLADFDPTSNVLEAAEAVLIWLHNELNKLPPTGPQEKQEETKEGEEPKEAEEES